MVQERNAADHNHSHETSAARSDELNGLFVQMITHTENLICSLQAKKVPRLRV
jgi:hypothetical protein